MEETFNKQNDRVYAWSSKKDRELVPRIQLGHYPGLGECPMTASLLYIFVKMALEQDIKNKNKTPLDTVNTEG